MPYRTLNLEKTKNTLERLVARIEERFPESGLLQVGRELHQIAQETESRIMWIALPNTPLRMLVGLLIFLFGVLFVLGFFAVDFRVGPFPMIEFIQALEAGLNDVVLIGAAIFFLVSIEARMKRARVLTSLNELRTIAHVIDMHQLTKDPTEIHGEGRDTASSPHRTMDSFELNRYLDYCSEMLSLTGKLASLYAQSFPDDRVVSSVNEVEELTTGLSRKIWQKIFLIQQKDQTTTNNITK